MFENNTGVCPNCGLASAFKRESRQRVWPKHGSYGQYGNLSDETEWMDLVVLGCLHCSMSTTVRDQYATMSTDSGTPERQLIHRTLVYPALSPRELDNAVPESVRSFYREASQCEQAGALRGASVLYRAAVEELVKDQGASGGNLYKRIETLTSGPAADLVDHLHEARMLGNDSIHDGLTYSAEEVDDIANLIDEATVILYVQPAERRRLRESRSQRRAANGATA